MKALSLVIALFLAVALAACGSVAESVQPAPTSTPLRQAAATALPTVEAEVSTSAAQGDPAMGQQLFTTFQPKVGTTCTACHRVDSDDRLVGPGLLHVAERAATRMTGVSAADYLHTSIVDPSAYVVDGYPDIMPKNWSAAFDESQLNDLVAYLMSLSANATIASASTSGEY